MPDAHEVLHATAIAVGERAALICGPSGSGKSDLALRCLMMGDNQLIKGKVRLVSDDYTQVRAQDGTVFLSAPRTIRNKLEVRGYGIVTVPALEVARLVLVAELVGADQIERLPDPMPRREIAGVSVPVLRLAAFEASAACKLLLAIGQFGNVEGERLGQEL